MNSRTKEVIQGLEKHIKYIERGEKIFKKEGLFSKGYKLGQKTILQDIINALKES